MLASTSKRCVSVLLLCAAGLCAAGVWAQGRGAVEPPVPPANPTSDPLLKGFSIGSGTRIASQTQGDPANDFQMPGYVTWNAMAAYKHKLVGGSTLTAQLNAYNLLDKRYYFGADQVDGAQRFNIMPAAPMNFMGSLRLEF